SINLVGHFSGSPFGDLYCGHSGGAHQSLSSEANYCPRSNNLREGKTPLGPSAGGQFPVLDAAWLLRIVAQATAVVLLIGLVVALEPHHLAVALEGEHVRGDAIQEPAIVADDDGAAGEVE